MSNQFKWLLTMAWRDTRRNRSRLFLFISSIILGIAALVSIYSLGDNLKSNVDLQAAEILGADLEISGNKEAPDSIIKLIAPIALEISDERSFASMVMFPKNNGSRLTQVRALKGNYPYYGKLETTPVNAESSFRDQQAALVDKTLMLQFEAKVGDSIQVGNTRFRIAGVLTKAPGQTGLSASVAPAVYIPMQFLDATGLMQKGSRINYKKFYKVRNPGTMDGFIENLGPRIENAGLDYETIESQKEDTGRAFDDLTQFLSLVAFIALLLGCIGVASAIHIYVKEKISMIAILRCLGATSMQSFWIFLIQILGIGLIGSIIGAMLGVFLQQLMPLLLSDLLPIEITTPVSWSAVLQGVSIGILVSLLFALVPLISVRRISPLNTLRISFQHETMKRDPLKWMVYALIMLFIIGFIYFQMDNWKDTFVFAGSMLLSFGILVGMATLLIWFVKKFFPVRWSYLWRQGLSNLFRPNNQTVILVVSIGLGTSLICMLIFIQSILLNRVTFTASGNQPNIVLFDIQTPQRKQVIDLAARSGLPLNPTVPIVNMRLEQWNGMNSEQYRADSSKGDNDWFFSREYRVTYRDTLSAFEKVTEGEWKGNVENGVVNISMEERYAERVGVKIGDTLVFNVQGAMIPTIVSSFREVDWNRIQTNFVVVFPKGVLEDAPQFHVLLTRVPSPEVSAKFQQNVVRQFPNISIIDLGLVLKVIDDLLNKIEFVIRFIAAFSIVIGLVVLISSVLISKYQRLQENVLLRTLGAVQKQILVITLIEYFFVGALAALTGIIIALLGSWALAEWSLDATFEPSISSIIIVFISISLLTVVVGLINSLGVIRKSPLEAGRES